MTLGQKLEKARVELRLHKRDVARRAGISETAYSYWERDISDPSFFGLCCVAEVLGLSLDYLAGRDEKCS